MKYKQGDVLVNHWGQEKEVLGVCGRVYFMSMDNNKDAADEAWTEEEVTGERYTLKTDTPTKTDMTVAEIAKKLGMKPEELNVVADK